MVADPRGVQRRIGQDLGVQPEFDAAEEADSRSRFLAVLLEATGLRTLVLGISGGVDSATPLAGLTKRRVRALAEHLGVPARIVTKTPRADLESRRPQLPDEDVLGLRYAEIDDLPRGAVGPPRGSRPDHPPLRRHRTRARRPDRSAAVTNPASGALPGPAAEPTARPLADPRLFQGLGGPAHRSWRPARALRGV